MPAPVDVEGLRTRVQQVIDTELAHQRQVLRELGGDTSDLLRVIENLLQGGKRLRAAFLYWGYRAVAGVDPPGLVRMAAAMEFFQAAALIHDDVMDDSAVRRGAPAAHRALTDSHAARAWEGSGDRFGLAGAILAGNLCLNWTDEIYATCGLPETQIVRGRPVFDRMRTQLMGGQYLDVVESVRPWTDVPTAERLARAHRVIRFKSAKYTVEHPLLIGALAAGAQETTVAHLSAYGLALGHAFQLRDDLLGVFGDPKTTGKPAGDDLREGKRTVLVAHALDTAPAKEAAAIAQRLGRPDLTDADIELVRSILLDSGAVDAVEAQIAELAAEAIAALGRAELPYVAGSEVLADLVSAATARAD